jgi:hypothetical protein
VEEADDQAVLDREHDRLVRVELATRARGQEAVEDDGMPLALGDVEAVAAERPPGVARQLGDPAAQPGDPRRPLV